MLDTLFVVTAFIFQIVLIIHFALRKWRFEMAMRFGPLVYALSIPAAVVSFILWWEGMAWAFWLSGFLYLAWAIFGYTVEYIKGTEWRIPFRWSIGVPYLLLYLATAMFYWWPLALISKPLWYAYAVLFVIGVILNLTSHRRKTTTGGPAQAGPPRP